MSWRRTWTSYFSENDFYDPRLWFYDFSPLKMPPDWRNWLTPIAVFLFSVFTDDSDSSISICDEDTDMISEILYCTIVH